MPLWRSVPGRQVRGPLVVAASAKEDTQHS